MPYRNYTHLEFESPEPGILRISAYGTTGLPAGGRNLLTISADVPATAPYRSTEATVVMAAEGSGTATVGDQTYTLQKNDIFVAPNWTWWQVEASDDLVLLSYSDRAALEKLDLWREQRANEPARP